MNIKRISVAIFAVSISAVLSGCGENAVKPNNSSRPESVNISSKAEISSETSTETPFTFPEGITTIKGEDLKDHKDITSIVIPEGVTVIEQYAFSGCSQLTDVTFPESLTEIGFRAFSGCEKLENIIIPQNSKIEKIDSFAFEYTGFTKLEIPEGVTDIEEGAFQGCKNLSSVSIPNSVRKIMGYAFSHCPKLESVTIPAGVETIGPNPFASCEKLTEILVDENNQHFRSFDGVLYSNDFSMLVSYPCARDTDYYYLASGSKSINDAAFNGCRRLKDVHIPNSVTKLGSVNFSFCKPNITVHYKGISYYTPDESYKLGKAFGWQ